MVLYLTSSFIPHQDVGTYEKLEPSECYGFFDDLREDWPEAANIRYVPFNPAAVT